MTVCHRQLRPGSTVAAMNVARDPHTIDTPAALEAPAQPVGAASIRKEVPHLHPTWRAWIAASPFAVVATVGPEQLDASPRGDPAGWVVIEDNRTLRLRERRGSNRIDCLRKAAPTTATGPRAPAQHAGADQRLPGTSRRRCPPSRP